MKRVSFLMNRLLNGRQLESLQQDVCPHTDWSHGRPCSGACEQWERAEGIGPIFTKCDGKVCSQALSFL